MFDIKKKKDNFPDSFGTSVRAMSDYMGLGVQIAASFAFFVFLGYEADAYFRTSPLFLLAGVIVGMVGMGLVLAKTARKANRKSDRTP